MKQFLKNPVARISLGLSLLTMSLLLGVEILGILPDPQKAVLDSRKKTCESLAVYASLSIQHGELQAIHTTLEVVQRRNEDIVSAALRKNDGHILTKVGEHDKYWHNESDKASTRENVQVPIFKDGGRWGTFEVSFKPLHANVFMSVWNRPLVKIILLVIPLAFLGYYLLMKKTLRHLDPTAVVPERVKIALDSLVEGVVLMDPQERIVLANKAFEKNLGDPDASLIGRKVSELNWTPPQPETQAVEYPWRQAIAEGVSQSAVPIAAQRTGGRTRTFMVNGAPIIDRDGKTRGALATFDDVTLIEAQNSKLQKMLDALKKSRNEVRRQNQALQVLATQDPLTGCLNRRAYFEKFEDEFNRARRQGEEFACVMLDIDHFKSVNDNHGHLVGDKVLQEISSILRDHQRDSDVVCRYGGEEFCLILTRTGTLGALKSAERLRRAISANPILGIPITVSMGVSSLEYEPSNPSELLGQADKALYEAKTNGRDNTIIYGEIRDKRSESSSGSEPVDLEKHKDGTHIPHHVVNALMLALEHRDILTAEHSRKVGELCAATAQDLMPINECAVLEIAGMLHDIGKLGVPDAILHKPGPLTDYERRLMKEHEFRSVDMIAATFMSPDLVDIARYRSHWFDGSTRENNTQPQGQDIPVGARILHIADAFDAMVSQRPYRQTRDFAAACRELRRCAGTQFDPELVEHFISVVNARDESRRECDASVSNSVKLEIGRQVEALLMAVNGAKWGDLSLTAGQLADQATKYGLHRIAEAASDIETAAMEQRGQIEIMQMASKLLGICGPIKGLAVETVEDKGNILAA